MPAKKLQHQWAHEKQGLLPSTTDVVRNKQSDMDKQTHEWTCVTCAERVAALPQHPWLQQVRGLQM